MHWQYPRCSRRRLRVSFTRDLYRAVSTPIWRAYMVSLDDYLPAFVALHTFFRLCDDLYPSARHLRDRRIKIFLFFLLVEHPFLYGLFCAL
jgi:hypothetical protein